MKSRKKQMLGKVAIKFLRGIKRRLSGKSLAQAYREGEGFGRLIYRLDAKHRERTQANLRMVFPDWPESQVHENAKKVFENFGRSSVDFLIGANRTLAELESHMKIEGREHLDAGLAQGKGVLLITGHLGNWERCSAWMSKVGYPVHVVARNADQDGVNRIVNEIREGPGTSVLARGNAARAIMEKLKAGEIVGILPDQNADDIFLPFFGFPAGTVLGPGVLAERTGAAVIPVVCVYEGDERYRLTFYPALTSLPDCEVKGEGMMRAINTWLEDRIRETPDQWLWMHDRWRNARRKGLL